MPAAPWISCALAAIGAGGAVLGYTYVHRTHHDAPARNEPLVQLAALALSEEVVKKTLQDSDVRRELGRFGLRVLKHPDVVQGLRSFFVHELTDNTPTRQHLKHFAVYNVVLDSWVRDELVDVVADLCASLRQEESVYPKGITQWLHDAAMMSLDEPVARQVLRAALQSALWHAIAGAPRRNGAA